MRWVNFSRNRGFLPLFWFFSKLYELGARLHRLVYAKGWKIRRELPCVVVSIGNISVGGSAKTPLVIETAQILAARGLRVCVASRGYGRRVSQRIEVVSDGIQVTKEWQAAGDEPILISKRLPGVPVVVGRDRGEAGVAACSRFKAEVLILDDGFQHHRLGRDVDLIAIDANTDLDEPMLLPAGRLREPVSVLSLADAFVVVGGELSSSAYRKLETLAPARPKFQANRVPRRLFELDVGTSRPLSTLKDKEVGIFCGIARPSSFRKTVESLGATIVATRFYSDHHKYVKNDVRVLSKEPSLWLTTEKDAVKLDPTWFPGVSISVLGIDLIFNEPSKFEKFLGESVEEAISQKSLRPDRTGRVV